MGVNFKSLNKNHKRLGGALRVGMLKSGVGAQSAYGK